MQAAKRPETVDVIPAPRPARRDIKFSVAPNQTLSSALRAYVIASGKRMQWNTRADFVIDHPYEVAGKEFADTLGTVLGPYGLTATIWDANLVVEIQQRNAEAEK